MKTPEIIPLLKLDNHAQGLPLRIQTIRHILAGGNQDHHEPHCHNHFEITFIRKGTGTFCIDMQKCAFQSSRVFCIRPGQVHWFHPDLDTDGYVISFSDTFLDDGDYESDGMRQASFLRIFSASREMVVSATLLDELGALVEKMIREYENNFAFSALMLKRLLNILLIYLGRQIEKKPAPGNATRDATLSQKFIDLLNKHFKEQKMVSEYADRLFVTPNYLNEIVKKNTGYSAGYHIRQRVVLEAKRMGYYSGVCMKEIAYNLGFSDSAHFSKFFKGVTGASFTDFRKDAMAWS